MVVALSAVLFALRINGDEFVGGALFGPETDAANAGDSAGSEVVVGCCPVELHFVLARCEVSDEHIVGASGVRGIGIVVEASAGPAELEDVVADSADQCVDLAAAAIGAKEAACSETEVCEKTATWSAKQTKATRRKIGRGIESFSVGSVGAASRCQCECG